MSRIKSFLMGLPYSLALLLPGKTRYGNSECGTAQQSTKGLATILQSLRGRRIKNP